ncbi:helix-turn-helix domain-containing protein [Candidatus Villigracilis saccharophilus]|uniref:helix-turn-helix domain-containing protein n=1 Tax=Candidatus Villigracilis saccharophilus TaxID=3140684 RepID=UPI0031350CBF|nr:helix-turn-helix domain-containing protein [Anaerolineales bacterium]
MGTIFSLGEKLRQLRDERNISQRDLARLAGLSPNSISLIERDETSPSVSTLQSLAAALNIRMSYFFEEETPSSVLHLKSGSRPKIVSEGLGIEGMGKTLPFQELEPFIMTLEPKAGSGGERQVVHSGHEFVYCLQGKIEYVIDGRVYLLEVEDILIFEATLPHLWRNPFDNEAKFILVLQTPNASREPVQRHFSSHPSVTHIGG